jgi:hypothetical protein
MAPEKSWTFMVYMAGDNNLDPQGIADLNEMKKVGSSPDVNVLAQFDRELGHVSKRYFIKKGGQTTEEVGPVNTGDPKNLYAFIEWGVKNYPAKQYALVLWNHGNGWDEEVYFADDRLRKFRRRTSSRLRHTFFKTSIEGALASANGTDNLRAILIDENAKDFLDNKEMKQILADTATLLGRKLDVLGMDACLMSMVEVGYQMRESVEFTVGSEEAEPGTGWPYDRILGKLVKQPAMTAQELCEVIVDQYLQSYDEPVTQSACNLAQAEAVAGAVAELAGTLRKSLETTADNQHIATKKEISNVREEVQAYDVSENVFDNIDLVDFCALLAQTTDNAEIAQCCQQVIQTVEDGYVVKEGYVGADLENSHGAAIYFPQGRVSSLYDPLDFNIKTGWADFLRIYKKTRTIR